MRVLGAIRQSKRKDASESPETQRRDIQAWAALGGHEIVGWAVDLGVSASVSPFRRPELGPWLTDPLRMAGWDAVAGWKVDRLVRSTWHFYGELMPELQKLNKHAVAVTEGINTATSSNLEILIRVGMAQDELDKIRSRAASSRASLRRAEKWHGGIAPFGYYAVRTANGVRLAIDEDALEALYTAKQMLSEGYTANAVFRYFNQEGILTAWDRHRVRMGAEPLGRLWTRTNGVNMLRSRHLMGEWMHKGQVLRRPDGRPVSYGEPLMDRGEWEELQALLGTPRERHRVSQPAPLTRVLYCAECGRAMYHRPPQGKERTRVYYCSSRSRLLGVEGRDCRAPRIAAEPVERMVEEMYLAAYGDTEIVIARAKARVDYRALITQLDERISNLAGGLGALRPGSAGAVAVTDQMAAAEAERDELVALAEEATEVEYDRTGRTYGQEWKEARTPNDRLDLLRRHHVTLMIQKEPGYALMRMGDQELDYFTMEW